MKCDFSGYATKNDLKCADGRVIRHNAFKDNDGSKVPLVWQHLHDDPVNVLGHAVLENRADGVYAYCSFNETEQAKHAKTLVKHGDIDSMSIYANKLVQHGSDVLHGVIREVSLVLAGANPGARIQNVSLEHSDGSHEEIIEEAVIHGGFNFDIEDELSHAADEEEKKTEENQNGSEEEVADGEKTIQDVVDSMTEEQKQVLYFLVGQAAEDQEVEDEDYDEEELAQGAFYENEGEFMKHNVFDNDFDSEETEALQHDIMAAIDDAKRNGDLKSAFIQHGIENIDVLMPEAKLIGDNPALISRPMDWVQKVWNGIKKSPFARTKSVAANVTADEARAKGYVKGKQKVEEVVSMLKRTTDPQTVYKLQKMDRDDVIDITDIDIVAWLKMEMRMMLDEEVVRAVLIGDGRSASDNDKIKEDHIRPIYQDNDVYTIHWTVDLSATDPTDRSNDLIDSAIRARKNYMGSGNPTMFACVDVINDMLLARDKMGRRLYNTMQELASALRVNEIVEVPVLEGVKRTSGEGSSAKDHELLALIVNLSDYTLGADKGGEVNFFDDFNIDFNKYEYLIETRCSGALNKPYSAIALEKDVVKTSTPSNPSVQG